MITAVYAVHAIQVAQIVQHCMESAVQLLVPLRVKLSQGDSWGSLVPLLVRHGLDSSAEQEDVSSSYRGLDDETGKGGHRTIVKNLFGKE